MKFTLTRGENYMSYKNEFYQNLRITETPDLTQKRLLFDFVARTRDIFVSAVGLLLISPFFLWIAYRIKRDSPGPIFYKGPRTGKGGKLFCILKFRTMYETPESYQGPNITCEDDPRITQFGCWLRDTKINELPQLWNVLIGDMSLVGPRPEDPDIVESWPEEIKKEVLSIRPGITSPASVLFRNEESLLTVDSFMETYMDSIQPNKMRLDQLYVRNRSLPMDFDVILWTFLILIPGFTNTQPPERLLYGGIIARATKYFTTWLVIDFIIAILAMVGSGLFWRLLGPIHIGLWAGAVDAITFAVVFTIVAWLFGIQRIHWSKADPSDVLDLFVSSLVATIIVLAIDLYFHPVPSEILILAAIFAFFGLVVSRYRNRVISAIATRWFNYRKSEDIYRERVLIIGSGDAGTYAGWMLSNSKEKNNFRVIGYIDDDFHKYGLRVHGINVLGNTNEIEEIVRMHDVSIILFAIHQIEEEKRAEILRQCESTNAQVVIFPNIIGHLSEVASSNGHVNESKNSTEILKPTPDKNKMTVEQDSFRKEMMAILKDLEYNLAHSDIEKCFENLSRLQKMIKQQEMDMIHE
jgi:lipopolysaccharide/colanic/teichoic acid biosynthesis glycosyltransferase